MKPGRTMFLPHAQPIQPPVPAVSAPGGGSAKIPTVLFDGFAVWDSLTDRAKQRTSPENVSDVLDAIVRLLRLPNQ